MKDMIHYRDKINQLIEDASKNNIHLEINKNPYIGLNIVVVDDITKERCTIKNTKIITQDETVMFMGDLPKKPRIEREEW